MAPEQQSDKILAGREKEEKRKREEKQVKNILLKVALTQFNDS